MPQDRIIQMWTTSPLGQVFQVKVISPAGRILANVSVDVPLLEGFRLEDRMSSPDGKTKIEKDAVSIAKRIAAAVQKSPQPIDHR